MLGDPRQLAADVAGPEVLDLAQRRGVEGPGLDPGDAQRAQPPAHLPGRARGEGHGEDLLGDVRTGEHAVGDPRGDRPRLAGARAGQHADRAAQGGGDLVLLGVERSQDGVG